MAGSFSIIVIRLIRKIRCLYSNFSRSEATVMIFVIDHTELSWCHPMDLLLGM